MTIQNDTILDICTVQWSRDRAAMYGIVTRRMNHPADYIILCPAKKIQSYSTYTVKKKNCDCSIELGVDIQ